jgi:hypothetical protein
VTLSQQGRARSPLAPADAYGLEDAGIDVHKKMLAIVIADVEVVDTWRFERRQVGTSPGQLRALAEWFVEREVDEVVMESIAQFWRPVWEALERFWQPRRRQSPAGPRKLGYRVEGLTAPSGSPA